MEHNNQFPITPNVVSKQDDTSPLIEVEQAIAEKLNGIKALKYVGDDYGQLDYYENRPPVAFPCVLIDTSEASYENISQNRAKLPQNRQIGTCVLSLLIADIRLQTNTITGRASSSPVKQIDIKEIVQLVHNELHGWCPGGKASKLQRTKQTRQRRNDGVLAYEMSYSFAIYDA